MDLGSIIDSYGLACPLEVWIDIEVMRPRKTILNPNSSRARYVFPKTHLLMQLSLLYIGNLLVLGVLGFRNLITSRTEEVQCQFTDGLVGYPTSFWKFTLLTILGPYRLLYFLVQGSSSAVI
jgi:hypothetical protein